MAIYGQRGEEYFMTKNWLLGDLHIPKTKFCINLQSVI